MANLGDLAAGGVVVRLNGLVADLFQSQGLGGSELILFTTDQAFDQFDLNLCHLVRLLNPKFP